MEETRDLIVEPHGTVRQFEGKVGSLKSPVMQALLIARAAEHACRLSDPQIADDAITL